MLCPQGFACLLSLPCFVCVCISFLFLFLSFAVLERWPVLDPLILVLPSYITLECSVLGSHHFYLM